MTWQNPPKFVGNKPKIGKMITPEQMAGTSEGSQQKALMVWAASVTDKYPQLKWLFHIPNGGERNLREAVELKAQGVKAGVPDLMLAYAEGNYYGMFIEMKVKPNKPTPEQIAWIDNLRSETYYVAVCYSWEEARDALINYFEGKV